MNRKNRKISVGFIALGCPKNVVDSERMLAEIAQGDFLIAAQPENADVIIINTCAFIEPAKQESLQAVKQAIEWKNNPRLKANKVIVAGCLSERMGQELLDQVKGIDAVVGLENRDNIAEIITNTLNRKEPSIYSEPVKQSNHLNIHDDRTRLLINSGYWAYLRISEGCNRQCSFCTIPSIRGQFRSKKPEMILQEAQELVVCGVAELNIIAQDTTFYGRDLKPKSDLVALIKQLETIESIEWIRLMYLYPTGINDELIKTISDSEKIVHYLDIPIQHINDKILKSMRRPDTKKQITELLEKLREAIPDIVLRTTTIVGFPGETDEQFNELMDFIKSIRFDALGCFKYYPESGTVAAKMPDQIPEDIKEQRIEELMLCQQNIAFEKNRQKIGKKFKCLVDSLENKQLARGRYYGQAPDIDSICLIRSNKKGKKQIKPGDFVDIKVVDFQNYDLIVEPF